VTAASAVRQGGVVAGVTIAVGAGLAVLAVTVDAWANVQFAAGAGGTAAEFGPVYRALVAFATASAGLLVTPGLAGLLGLVAGSQFHSPARGAAVAGTASLAGTVVAGALVAAAASLTGGPQAFSLGSAVVPVVVAAGVAGAAGAVGGTAGSTLVR
jgi:hypothetical protein